MSAPDLSRIQTDTTKSSAPGSKVVDVPSEPHGDRTQNEPSVLSIEALTGLRTQVENAGDPQMLAHIDRELSVLRSQLETR